MRDGGVIDEVADCGSEVAAMSGRASIECIKIKAMSRSLFSSIFSSHLMTLSFFSKAFHTLHSLSVNIFWRRSESEHYWRLIQVVPCEGPDGGDLNCTR